MATAIYLHIPFCLRKCRYCDFFSLSVGRVEVAAYLATLLLEMALTLDRLNVAGPVDTLYLGGGTPSLLPPEQVARLVEGAARHFALASAAEITLEANPGTLTAATLAGYRAAGVNRLSLGVQSFSDLLLRRLGRVHTAAEAVAAFRLAREAGYDSIGIDLIHSLPGQTPAQWAEELEQAVTLGPDHISAYPLTVETGTPFARLASAGRLPLPAEEEAAAMFMAPADLLPRYGYEHYELANFARPGRQSRHNRHYWLRESYLGFGAGAHSFLAEPEWGCRWQNPADLNCYLETLARGELPAEGVSFLSQREAMAEWFFLGLRLLEGVDLDEFRSRFGCTADAAYPEVIPRLVRQGLLAASAGRVSLTRRALPVANGVFSRFV